MRYLPHTSHVVAAMLQEIGVDDINALFTHIPAKALHKAPFAGLPKHQNEQEVGRNIAAFAEKNRSANQGSFFLGAGCYYHHIPAAVDYLIQRSEFLTAYTPYQPEVSQGTLTTMFEFQSYIAALTGMDVANASMYDGATSMVEAALMAKRLTKRPNIHIATPLHPHYMETLATYWHNQGGEYCQAEATTETACIIVQNPDFYGNMHDISKFAEKAQELSAKLVVVTTEILSLGLLPAPTDADIVCGEAQSIGVPMAFGGPGLGFFACKEPYMRHMPGRLIGETTDLSGKITYCLTLNTREQHIRREKATSNICTNVGLCALAFTIHASLLGKNGFKSLALLNHQKACALADALQKIQNITLLNNTFFNEFTIQITKNSQYIIDKLAQKGIIGGYPVDSDKIVLAATECTTSDDIDHLCIALQEVLAHD